MRPINFHQSRLPLGRAHSRADIAGPDRRSDSNQLQEPGRHEEFSHHAGQRRLRCSDRHRFRTRTTQTRPSRSTSTREITRCPIACTVPAPRTSTSTALTRRPARPGTTCCSYIRPALRVKVEGKSQPQIQPTDAVVKENFAKIFGGCENTGSPTEWNQLPSHGERNRNVSSSCTMTTAPYKGVNASLPPELHLWPKNKDALEARPPRWPQFSVGAFPYCFRLP